MSLRQREWAIYIRPYYSKQGNKISYSGTPKAAPGDVGERGSGALALRGNCEGGGEDCVRGGWTMWYHGTSFKLLREKYKEALDSFKKEDIQVAELIKADTIVTPLT